MVPYGSPTLERHRNPFCIGKRQKRQVLTLDDVQKVVWGLSGSVAQWIATDSQKIMYFVNQKQTRVLCLIDGVWSKKIHKIKHRKT